MRAAGDVLTNQGVLTKLDVADAMAQTTIMSVDGAIIIANRCNFPKASQEKPAEQGLRSRDQALAAQPPQNWRVHAPQAECDMGGAR